jgi:hypothetical protein
VNRRVALVTAVSAMVAAAGCSSSARVEGRGSAKVAVRLPATSLAATSINKATLTIGPGVGTPTFANIVVDLANQDPTGKLNWSGHVQGIPAGTGRTFHVEASDGANPARVLYSGDATTSIAAGGTASVVLMLQETNPGGGSSNKLPVIDSLTASSSSAAAGTSLDFSVTAHALDAGANLSYRWNATCGSLANAGSRTPTWTAPGIVPPSASCQVDVSVTSGAQGSVTASMGVAVFVVPTVGTFTASGGGTITSGTGVTLTAPAGAVGSSTTISVTQLVGQPPPEAMNAVSPVYEFGPSGLVFSQPITVALPIPAGVVGPTVYWSNANGIGYSDIGGTIVGTTVQAPVTHFSSGFVGARNYCSQNVGMACQSTSQCRSATCQPDGTCLEGANLPDGTSCSSGNACTQGEVCGAGVCGGGALVCTPTGAGAIAAYTNSRPIITGIVATETFIKDASGKIVAIDVDLVVSAADPDGDDLAYVWTSDCALPAGFTDATHLTPVATLSTGPGALPSSTVHFTSTILTRACALRVDVKDFWANGNAPAGSGLSAARGGDTIGQVIASLPVDFVLGPQITNATSPNASNQVQPGQAFVIGVDVVDPTPAFNTGQTPFTYAWSSTGGISLTPTTQLDVTTSPGRSLVQVIVPNPVQVGMTAQVIVTNRAGLKATYSWVFVPM